jgi:hypothetical protein
MKVQFFVPIKPPDADLETVLQEALSERILLPFDAELVNFVTDFAKSILIDKQSRDYPELIVMANFFKSANVARLRLELEGRGNFLARGLVFHIAPSNIDSVFLYSSLLSLLCGNLNLIRISQGAGDQIQFIIKKMVHLLSQEHAAIADRFYLITYEHNDAITALISQHCHMRVVWGGDNTVNKIRSIPLRPMASEICFPDRFSASIFRADAVLNLDRLKLLELCSRFFNDSILFAQQACSSPRLISWIGSNHNCATARHLFWQAFDHQLSFKEYENSPSMVMDRFVSSCMVATDPVHCETTSLLFPTRILLSNRELAEVKHFHCGNGLFYEQYFETVPQFLQTLTDREQTLSVFGFDTEEMKKYSLSLPIRAIDRITKIGNALDFNYIWDGYNLLQAFTRQISFKL